MLSKFLKQHKNPANDIQHNIFVKYFVEDIALTIKAYGEKAGYNLNSQFYEDLAWGGVTGTDAFKALPEEDRNRTIWNHYRADAAAWDKAGVLAYG